jgi:hypothetical protein
MSNSQQATEQVDNLKANENETTSTSPISAETREELLKLLQDLRTEMQKAQMSTDSHTDTTVSVDDNGPKRTHTATSAVDAIKAQTVPDAPTASPFSLDEIEKYRRFPVVRQQFQQMRTKELLEHNRYMKARGPEIEKALGVSAKKIFKQGDSAAASRLMKENPQGYRWLKEYANYL